MFVCLFNFRMSLKFRVDIRSRGDSLRNLSFVKAEGSDALLDLSQYKLDFSKLKKSERFLLFLVFDIALTF